MDFSFDPSLLPTLPQILQFVWTYLRIVFYNGGWLVLLVWVSYKVIQRLWELYMDEIHGQFLAGSDRVLLAIKVPKLTEQTPKAVENIFSHLTGLYTGKGNMVDRYIKGKIQENFSCEIVSKDGVVQFFINTPTKFRDVVEASIFAQYPDVEITQVPDYVDAVPQSYPNETHDMWGSELTLVRPQEYPIKTYQAFEHVLPGSFKDPIASLLEFLGTMRPGEQVWIQIAMQAVEDDWQKDSENLVKKLIGVKVPSKKPHGIVRLFAWLFGIVEMILNEIFSGFLPAAAPKKEDSAPPSLMQHLSPGDRMVVEQIQMKASKPGFKSKIRIMYIAPKELYNKGKILSGVLGAFKQYASSNLNGFKPESASKVSADYVLVDRRLNIKRNRIMNAYKKRKTGYDDLRMIRKPLIFGGKPYILNIEELATIWHFPMVETKAPLIRKSEFKRAEPPSELPMRDREAGPVKKSPEPAIEQPDDMPSNLPFA